MRILLKGKHIPCKTLIWKSNDTWEKKKRRSQLVNDKQLYLQSNGHKKKGLQLFDFVESFHKPCSKIYVLMRNWKIAESISLLGDIESAQRIQIFFSVSSFMMCCQLHSYAVEWYKRNFSFYLQYMMILSRFTLRRTRPVKPQNRKSNISAAFLHLKIKKHF